MFTKILIANRGEIACRVAATARRMGIRTVAVYSEADAHAAHVAACDEALAIGPAAAKDSYLRGDKIIAAALATGAQAIHPGYGFLSENADFADACAAAGLVFIGPPASAMRAMGSKSAAKQLMEQAGVPLVPGYHGDNQDPDYLHRQADRIGYPVLLKASAGGGGKGMRVVASSDEFPAALASCQREAINSFGDDKVLAEKYLQRPRHIEIQVFADTLGNYVYLHERDCSVQRRHQKVLEEAPAPGMTPERRAAMGEAAVAAARAVGYVGAGTVEFIANQDGSFYFMEMNTRLQVEHPVTELITGTDLVEWQLRVAAGQPLPKQQHELEIDGHAIEARIYAENPEKGFLPSIGTLRHLRTPAAVGFQRGEVRIDSGVREGDAISPHYDPMIAKLIVHGADRKQALARMAQALEQYRVVGLATNIAFLRRLVHSRAFAGAELDTGLIERNQEELFPAAHPAPDAALALAAVALLASERQDDSDPWAQTSGWRMNQAYVRTLSFADEAQDYRVAITYGGKDWRCSVDGGEQRTLSLAARDGDNYGIQLGGHAVHGAVLRDLDTFHVWSNGVHHALAYNDPMAHAGVAEAEGGRLTAPMPGKVVAVLASKGQQVGKGTPLVIMEAMKMEHTIAAPHDGLVEDILYSVGDQVADGAPLLAFKAA
ncbi:acetyl/propionyl/methylcrotonyl-CoA carboxylase subunit alpha [Oxalobacteraceae bacterium A2-2]